ncbi:MAG: winged helix-turn-helix transcriptional regulator [Erysipelotrichaceae bacterium]|nr:winged helix-turn-helix transcriptional regulator [Erysipelotrichaceae bacterium]
MTIENQEELIKQCVDLYYNRDLSQSEIAKQLYISRSSVSRMLKAARDRNMVRIIIDDDSAPRAKLLEEIFRNQYDLENVIITAENRYDRPMDLVAKTTARYLDSIVFDGMVLAVSRGKTLKAVADLMQSGRKLNLKVVQLIGLMNNPEKNDDEMDISKLIAKAYGGDYYNLYSPLMIEDEKVREIFNRYAAVGLTLEIAESADTVLTSIGAYSIEDKHIISNSYLSDQEKQELIDKGVVGLICGHYYDVDGNLIETSIEDDIIGLKFDQILEKNVIGVAGGKNKVLPILGALHGHFLDTLITDEITALNVLIADRKCVDMFR